MSDGTAGRSLYADVDVYKRQSLDGSTGNIYDGIIPTVDATIAGEFGRIMGWADKYRTMKVRTNAEDVYKRQGTGI